MVRLLKLGLRSSTNATDFDTQYFFMKVPKTGLYKGLSLRVREFSRSATNFGPAPGDAIAGLFKYDATSSNTTSSRTSGLGSRTGLAPGAGPVFVQ